MMRARLGTDAEGIAEAVLFLTFPISFILRVLPRIEIYEPLDADTYGERERENRDRNKET